MSFRHSGEDLKPGSKISVASEAKVTVTVSRHSSRVTAVPEVGASTKPDSVATPTSKPTLETSVSNVAKPQTNFGPSRSVSFGEIFCRICHDYQESGEALAAPCHCKGTIRYVHISCLEQWLETAGAAKCELCNVSYDLRLTRVYSMCSSMRIWAREEVSLSAVIFDVLSFVILTPIVFAGVFLCVSASRLFHGTRPAASHLDLTTAGLAILCATIVLAYLIWLVSAVRYYYQGWGSWWRSKVAVKVVAETYTQTRRKSSEEVNAKDAKRPVTPSKNNTVMVVNQLGVT